MEFLYAPLAFLGGGLIAYLNYRVSRHLLRKEIRHYALGSVLRQLVNIAYLVLIFFTGKLYLAVGATLGVTLPTVYFTVLLLRSSSRKDRNEEKGE